jgi:hypothetical protein
MSASRQDRAGVTLLARASLLGGTIFTALVAVLHIIEPGFDPISRTVSEYVLGSNGWVLTLAAMSFAMGIFALAAALWLHLLGPRPRAGLCLLAVAGAAAAVVASAPGDPLDPLDPQVVTVAGAVHAIAGVVWFSTFAVAVPLLTGRLARTAERPLAAGLRAAAVAVPSGFVLFWFTAVVDRGIGRLFGRITALGLGERVMAATFLIWLGLAAVTMLRSRQQAFVPGQAGAS